MGSNLFVWIFFVLSLTLNFEVKSYGVAANEKRGINGGLDCAVCTVLFGLATQVAQIHNRTIIEASVDLCSLLPTSAVSTCTKAVKLVEPVLLNNNILNIVTPDVVCYGVGLCYKDPGENYCHLFPKPAIGFKTAVTQFEEAIKKEYGPSKLTWNLCKLPGIKNICEALSKSINQIKPALDVDNDWFSSVESARGTHWRGRDCDDLDPLVYPGRYPRDNDVGSDSNCNGIYGRDTATGESLETQLCNKTGSRGVIFMGDSVSAHFHFPQVWMDPQQINKALIQNVSTWILNEGDWPQLGFATGYTNTSEPKLIQGYTDSIYLRMRQLNRCNHRDYQNLSRNGAASNTVLRYMESVARNATRDHPALVIYGLFGNDVCNNYKDTLSNMTTPVEFKSNVMEVLQFLDTVLPTGSHVLLIGLVDGSFIFPAMHNRTHPLGSLHKNIRYTDLYRWFTCMQIGPCNGWMTNNSTLRKITSKASADLSSVLQKLAANQKFSSFELHYLDNPLSQVMWEWQQQGHPIWQMIDPIDSLHPSQIAQPLIADVLWRNIMQKFPHILGDVNPNNDKIQQLFGDQGGH